MNQENPTPIAFNGVTFESVRTDSLPQIRVGYRGKFVVSLFQYDNHTPHPEGITFGQWFAMPVGEQYAAAVLAITPAGHELEALKKIVAGILTAQTQDGEKT